LPQSAQLKLSRRIWLVRTIVARFVRGRHTTSVLMVESHVEAPLPSIASPFSAVTFALIVAMQGLQTRQSMAIENLPGNVGVMPLQSTHGMCEDTD